MDIRFEAAPDRARITRAFRHVLRPSLRIQRLLGAVLVIDGGLVLWRAPGELEAGLMLLLLGLVIGLLAPFSTIRQTVAAWWQLNNHVTTYECTEAGLRVSAPLRESRYEWPAFCGVRQLPDQLLFLLARRVFIAVPTAGLTAEQVAQLHAAVPRVGQPAPS